MEPGDLHQNHRQRMHQRVREHGLDSLAEHEVLEYLLYFAIPRKDTNPLAHRLIDHFGSLCQVLEASEDDLAAVPGMGRTSARLLHLLLPLDRYYYVQKRKEKRSLKTTQEMIDYLIPLYHGVMNEVMYLVMMDDSYQILRLLKVGEGLPNSVTVSVHDLARDALQTGGTCALLSHNHPRSTALPSAEDINATERIAAGLGLINIALVDHIIIAGDTAVSLRASGRLPEYDPLQGKVYYASKRKKL